MRNTLNFSYPSGIFSSFEYAFFSVWIHSIIFICDHNMMVQKTMQVFLVYENRS